jgi:hypothetical protein
MRKPMRKPAATLIEAAVVLMVLAGLFARREHDSLLFNRLDETQARESAREPAKLLTQRMAHA